MVAIPSRPIYLIGVGSNALEVYLDLCEEIRTFGKSALMGVDGMIFVHVSSNFSRTLVVSAPCDA